MIKDQLKEYFEAEFEKIEAVKSELFAVVRDEKLEYSTAELAAIATFIHNIYNGFESLLKRTLAAYRIKIEDSPTWHKDLLKTSSDMGIISNEIYVALSDYLSFRHFFVHAYSFTLKWEELKPLVDGIEEILGKFRSAVYNFIDKHD